MTPVTRSSGIQPLGALLRHPPRPLERYACCLILPSRAPPGCCRPALQLTPAIRLGFSSVFHREERTSTASAQTRKGFLLLGATISWKVGCSEKREFLNLPNDRGRASGNRRFFLRVKSPGESAVARASATGSPGVAASSPIAASLALASWSRTGPLAGDGGRCVIARSRTAAGFGKCGARRGEDSMPGDCMRVNPSGGRCRAEAVNPLPSGDEGRAGNARTMRSRWLASAAFFV